MGGVLTLKISNKSNENVTTSIMIWATILLLPFSLFFEQPWNLTPRLDSTISLIYLGIFATGIAWLLRFYILKKNGLVFQAQVAYLIPIFGVILGFIFLDEAITSKIIISLIAVIIGIYIVKRGSKIKIV
jgi:drug/metabolite transporter (DMT)-like permease